MEITRAEENKNKRIAIGITLFAFTTLILFLVFKNILTTNPPFQVGPQNEMTIGLSNNGDYNNSAGKTGVVSMAKQKNESADKKIATDPNAENINVKNGVEKITEQYKNHHTVSDNSQDKNNESLTPGITDEKGISVQEKKNEETTFGFDLAKRTIIAPPKFTSDTKEEGKVIVEVVVNKDGNVIEANPNGRGTTTSSAALKNKARQMAIVTKFNANHGVEEQRGTITIVFSFD